MLSLVFWCPRAIRAEAGAQWPSECESPIGEVLGGVDLISCLRRRSDQSLARVSKLGQNTFFLKTKNHYITQSGFILHAYSDPLPGAQCWKGF